MSSSTSDANLAVSPKRSRLMLLVVFAACAAPFVLSYLTYYFWQPEGRMNYGDLVETKPLPPADLATLDGTRLALADLRGKWLLLHADSGACAEACRKQLYFMRQVRLAQGKNMDRVERVWLLVDEAAPQGPDPRVLEGMHILRAEGSPLVAALPASGDVRDHVFIVDPLGNVVLRFPANPDPKRMIKDLQRLLKASRIG